MSSSPLPIIAPTNFIAPRFKDMELKKLKRSGAYTALGWIEVNGVEKGAPIAVTSFSRMKAAEGCYCRMNLKRRLQQHRAEFV